MNSAPSIPLGPREQYPSAVPSGTDSKQPLIMTKKAVMAPKPVHGPEIHLS
jgi:hypothetical protein